MKLGKEHCETLELNHIKVSSRLILKTMFFKGASSINGSDLEIYFILLLKK